jgi:superfamily II DNA/RNA helicase
VRELASSLKRSGFAAGQIQGDMDQSDRIAEFDRFKNDEITILVASDVAARGLDVKGVSHVINFDVPWQPDDYIHRIGRTGRAGMTGIAITLASREDGEAIGRIEKLIGHKIPRAGAPKEGAGQPEAREAPKQRQPAKREPARKEEPAKREPAPKAEPVPKAESPRKAERTRPPREEAAKVEPPRERTPVVEDIKSDWNGPLPGFLSVSAG